MIGVIGVFSLLASFGVRAASRDLLFVPGLAGDWQPAVGMRSYTLDTTTLGWGLAACGRHEG